MLRSQPTVLPPPTAPLWQMRLEWRARWRHGLRHPWIVAAAAALVLALGLVARQRLRADGEALLSTLDAQPLLLVVAAFVLLRNLTLKASLQVRRSFARSWFAATPLTPSQIERAIRAHVGARVLPLLLAMLLVPLAAMAASGRHAPRVLAMLALGSGLGLAFGWRTGARAPPPADAPLPRLARTQPVASNTAGFAALARWPFARWLADVNPRLHAQLVAGVLLTLPMSVPPMVALLLVLFVASLIAAWGLLQALLATIPDAAQWMHATPLSMPAFVRAICTRACLVLVAMICVAALCLALLRCPTTTVLAGGAGALAWCLTAVLNALGGRHQPARARLERIVSGLLVAILLGTAAWLLPIVLVPIWLRDVLRLRRA